MNPAYDDSFARLYIGDAIDVLSQLPEKSVHMCVTSPPYFGLRSYLPPGHPDKAKEGGTQQTPEAYTQWLVEVMRGVWRVLRDDGTLWLNLGDSYANDGKWGGSSGGKHVSALHGNSGIGRRKVQTGLKPKDLIGIPWLVAFALRADGWYLRSEITWVKPAPMPESVRDRPTSATEKVFLFSKKPSYFYDQEAVREPNSSPEQLAHNQRYAKTYDKYDSRANGTGQPGNVNNVGIHSRPGAAGRNTRNYWLINPKPFPGSHYATFPPDLPMKAIQAGTSERGVCGECKAPWRRVVEREEVPKDRPSGAPWLAEPSSRPDGYKPTGLSADHYKTARTVGWEPTCSHDAEITPAVVLDPFMGSGTTAMVARKLGRRSIGVDLDARNVRLLEQRMGYQGVLL